jgi:hypothetical protein
MSEVQIKIYTLQKFSIVEVRITDMVNVTFTLLYTTASRKRGGHYLVHRTPSATPLPSHVQHTQGLD